MRTPTTSTSDSVGSDVENRSPPTTTVEPLGSASPSVWERSVSAVFVAAGTFVTVPSNCRRMSAACASSLTIPVTVSENGSVTARTPSSFSRSAMASSIEVV